MRNSNMGNGILVAAITVLMGFSLAYLDSISTRLRTVETDIAVIKATVVESSITRSTAINK